MSRIFVGLCESGVWGCFDEFNRLEPDVLSRVSEDIFEIQTAIKSKEFSANLTRHRRCTVDPTCAIFTTMNPTGYLGRSELPNNLKSLFRIITINTTDELEIVEVLLLSQGILPNVLRGIPKSLVELFNYFTMISPYELWKQVVKVCSSKLDCHKSLSLKNNLVLAIKEVVEPKLVHEDLIKFQNFIYEFFPAVNVSSGISDNEILNLCEQQGLSTTGTWLSKVYQLHQIIPSNHGILIYGDTAVGKSSAIDICAKISNAQVFKFDPISIQKSNFIGHRDETTGDWIDGCLSSRLRSIYSNGVHENYWIVLDSDVNPDWVESLNSLLDDNKILSLPTGERIPLLPGTRIIIETSSTSCASLATISRCSNVFFPSNCLTFKCIYQKLFFDVSSVLESVGLSYEEIVRTVAATLTDDVLSRIFHIYFEKLADFDDSQFLEATESASYYSIAATFVSLIIGNFKIHKPQLSNNSQYLFRLIFLAFLQSICNSFPKSIASQLSQEISPLITNNFIGQLPSMFLDNTLLDFCLNTNGEWIQISELVPAVEPSLVEIENDCLIPTQESVYMQQLLDVLFTIEKSVLLTGKPGLGKSVNIFKYFKNRTDVEFCYFNLSKEFSPSIVTKKLLHLCSFKPRGSHFVLSPTNSKKIVLFLDEINLPQLDTYSQSVVSIFVRQILNLRSIFIDDKYCHLDNLTFWRHVIPPKEVGRSYLSSRLLRYFSVVHLDYPSSTSMFQIYSTFLKSICSEFKLDVTSLANSLCSFVISLFSFCKQKFTTELVSSSLRDISRWVNALLSALKSSQQDSLTAESFISLGIYEAFKLFGGKIIDADWNELFHQQFSHLLRHHLGSFVDSSLVSEVLSKQTVFSSIITGLYSPIAVSDLQMSLQSRIKSYHKLTGEFLVPTVDFCNTLLQIDGIFKQSSGHILLLGPNGLCKSSILKFYAHISNFSISFMSSLSDYSLASFITDVSEAVVESVRNSRHVIFVIDDHLISDSSFLEAINSLLSQSDVLDILDSESLSRLHDDVSRQLKSKVTVMSEINKRVRKFLSICYCYSASPTHADLSLSSALLNRYAVVTCQSWKLDSLKQLATELLQSSDSYGQLNDIVKVYDSPPLELLDQLFHVVARIIANVQVISTTYDISPPSMTSIKSFIYTYSSLISTIFEKFKKNQSKFKNLLELFNHL
ncbi:hypothetical protein GEMRC1_012963 [Eukaryota sp. GEM-RC1]